MSNTNDSTTYICDVVEKNQVICGNLSLDRAMLIGLRRGMQETSSVLYLYPTIVRVKDNTTHTVLYTVEISNKGPDFVQYYYSTPDSSFEISDAITNLSAGSLMTFYAEVGQVPSASVCKLYDMLLRNGVYRNSVPSQVNGYRMTNGQYNPYPSLGFSSPGNFNPMQPCQPYEHRPHPNFNYNPTRDPLHCPLPVYHNGDHDVESQIQPQIVPRKVDKQVLKQELKLKQVSKEEEKQEQEQTQEQNENVTLTDLMKSTNEALSVLNSSSTDENYGRLKEFVKHEEKLNKRKQEAKKRLEKQQRARDKVFYEEMSSYEDEENK